MKNYGQTLQTITKLYQSAENNIVKYSVKVSSLEDITEMVKEEFLDAGEEVDLGWDNGVAANCHQFTADGQPNEKWVSPDGKYEVIFDSSGRIVTASEDYGTYNYCSPNDDPVGHAIKDVVPWILWGNSEDDDTKWHERLAMMVSGGS